VVDDGLAVGEDQFLPNQPAVILKDFVIDYLQNERNIEVSLHGCD
jgi:hypothetical protein